MIDFDDEVSNPATNYTDYTNIPKISIRKTRIISRSLFQQIAQKCHFYAKIFISFSKLLLRQ